jgi:hypothetical protein
VRQTERPRNRDQERLKRVEKSGGEREFARGYEKTKRGPRENQESTLTRCSKREGQREGPR